MRDARAIHRSWVVTAPLRTLVWDTHSTTSQLTIPNSQFRRPSVRPSVRPPKKEPTNDSSTTTTNERTNERTTTNELTNERTNERTNDGTESIRLRHPKTTTTTTTHSPPTVTLSLSHFTSLHFTSPTATHCQRTNERTHKRTNERTNEVRIYFYDFHVLTQHSPP